MSKFYLLITFCVLPFYWLKAHYLLKFGSRKAIEKEMKRYPKHYFGLRGIKVVAHGKIPNPDESAIYISNHQSMNDIFVAMAIIKKPVRFVAKIELFQNVITSPFMRLSQSYPLDRSDAKQSLLTLKKAVNDSKEGHTLVVFPEGTRSKKKEMLEFKDGIFQMLRKAEAPLIPMYIKESFDETQKEMHVYFGEAVKSQDYQGMNGKALSVHVKAIMQSMYDDIYMKK